MMNAKTLILIVLALPFMLNGQNDISSINTLNNTRKQTFLLGVQLSNEFKESFAKTGEDYDYYLKDKSTSITPLIGYSYSKNNKNAHTFQLNKLQFLSQTRVKFDTINDQIVGEQFNTTSVAVSYIFSFILNKKENARLIPSLGFGITPYFHTYNSTPVISTLFPYRRTQVGSRYFMQPSLAYQISSKLFCNIGLNVNLLDKFILSEKVQNPSIPLRQQKITTFSTELLPLNKIDIQTSIGYTF